MKYWLVCPHCGAVQAHLPLPLYCLKWFETLSYVQYMHHREHSRWYYLHHHYANQPSYDKEFFYVRPTPRHGQWNFFYTYMCINGNTVHYTRIQTLCVSASYCDFVWDSFPSMHDIRLSFVWRSCDSFCLFCSKSWHFSDKLWFSRLYTAAWFFSSSTFLFCPWRACKDNYCHKSFLIPST